MQSTDIIPILSEAKDNMASLQFLIFVDDAIHRNDQPLWNTMK